jgi:NADPH-dependent 2,4-dienoyl-CoA reductase/sulfur reductase-like enzyme/nitrite reductase/ring-hydroxylating ferredoxin subunit
MGDAQESLPGPDLTKGVSAADVVHGAVLVGHVAGNPVLLTRCDGKVVAVGARCPHYGAPLGDGLIVGDTIRCPWHHAAFSLRTGKMLRPPALGDLPCWETEERDGRVAVLERRFVPIPPEIHASVARAPSSVVIIGGGAAGVVAAQTLREAGYDRPITLIESGPSAPYDRPNLSKDYLAGTASEDWLPLHPPSFYQEQGIDLVLNARVDRIDTGVRRIVLGDATTREYGALLIATGATPVTLDIPNPGQRVHYLRTLADSRALIEASEQSRRAVVLGASFIGLEVAAALRARGVEVTVVGPESRPLERILGTEVGDFVRRLHEAHGVTFHLGQTASTIDADAVVLQSGERLPADLVIAGIGVRPNIGLAQDAGLETDWGIVVDEYLETNVAGIYAAGDVARWPDWHTGERIRVEHWVVAQRQGQTAARNMLAGTAGMRERFEAVPFFWSQHYDVTIAYVGHATHWDTIALDGDLYANDCAITYQLGGRPVATATVFRDRENLAAELAMEERMGGEAHSSI